MYFRRTGLNATQWSDCLSQFWSKKTAVSFRRQKLGPFSTLLQLITNWIYRVTVNCSEDWDNIHIYKDRKDYLDKRQSSNHVSAIILNENRRKRRSIEPAAKDASNAKCNNIKLPMNFTKMEAYSLYNFSVSSIFYTGPCAGCAFKWKLFHFWFFFFGFWFFSL